MNGETSRIFATSIYLAMVALPAPLLVCAQATAPSISGTVHGTAGATPRF